MRGPDRLCNTAPHTPGTGNGRYHPVCTGPSEGVSRTTGRGAADTDGPYFSPAAEQADLYEAVQMSDTL